MKPIAILCDIDGTIALRGDRDPYDHQQAMEDTPNWPVIEAVFALHAQNNWEVILVSARREEFREITQYWLWTHRIASSKVKLFMRDNTDFRTDQLVKRDMYTKHIEPFYTVRVVFDDRQRVVDMWRDLGLTVFQVAKGDY